MERIRILLLVVLLFVNCLLVGGLFDLYSLDPVSVPVLERHLLYERLRSFEIIRDIWIYAEIADVNAASSAGTDYSMILLEKVSSDHNISTGIYDCRGNQLQRAGTIEGEHLYPMVTAIIAGEERAVSHDVSTGYVSAALPVRVSEDNALLYRNREIGDTVAVMTFNAPLHGDQVLKSAKKMVLLLAIAAISILFLFLLRRSPVDKLFDR